MTSDAEFLGHEPCPECGSSNNLGRWADGHAYCFGHNCDYKEPASDEFSGNASNVHRPRGAPGSMLLECEIRELPPRGIDEKTCRKFGYGINRERACQVAPYRNKDGKIVGQKLRFADKKMPWIGSPKEAVLWGRHLWRTPGKRVIITEGEIDAMAVAQVLGLTWPTVSLVNGASGAEQDIRKSIDWLVRFDEIVLCFDQDEPGRAATEKAAAILPPGKVRIVRLPRKDPGEMLKTGEVKELIRSLWDAEPWRPDGIVNGSTLLDAILEPVEMGVEYPWTGLSDMLYGLRGGELVTLTSGTGIGKSSVCAEIAYHLFKVTNDPIGYIALEENVGKSAKRLVGVHLGKPIMLPGVGVDRDTLVQAYNETLGTKRFYFYDHFGSLDIDNMLNRIRYLVTGEGVKWVFLDHLSIMVSGMDATDDERRTVDRAMTMLRSLVEETGVGMVLVSHLRRKQGQQKSHEEGGQVSLSDLRSSQAIAQLSDAVIGLERDQQGEQSNQMTIRVLKNRYAGITGEAGILTYDQDTGRLTTGASPETFDDNDKELPF